MGDANGVLQPGGPNKYAVHLMLVPGDGSPDHSRILWYLGQPASGWAGAEWGWQPNNLDCQSNPSTGFLDRLIAAPGMNLFCSSNSMLPGSPPAVLLAGGTDPAGGQYGERGTKIYLPGSGTSAGTWSTPGLLKSGRWYPSTIATRTRMLAMGGEQHRHHNMLFGKQNGATPTAPSADTLHRFGAATDGHWETPTLPIADPVNGRPEPREGHTGLDLTGIPDFGEQVYFGGLQPGSPPQARNDVWFLKRDDNPTGTDYTYRWLERFPANPPPGRSEHTAVAALGSMMVVYGGRDANGSPVPNDVYRLFKTQQGAFSWATMTQFGPLPAARYGHAAVYDENTVPEQGGGLRKRMVMFGGTGADGQPADLKVWELKFDPADPTVATWSALPETTLSGATPPAPRHGHRMVFDLRERTPAAGVAPGTVAYLYGGRTKDNGGAVYSDTLWALWLLRTGKVLWQPLMRTGTPPGPRARHSLSLDTDHGGQLAILYVFGGENASGATDKFVYTLEPWATSSPANQWKQADDLHVSLAGHTGHTGTNSQFVTFARYPELYDPVAGVYQEFSNSPLLRPWSYPNNFLVPGTTIAGGEGRIVNVGGGGEVNAAYRLDLPAAGTLPGAWTALTSPGFSSVSAAQYLPGKIVVAGGRNSSTAMTTGATRVLDTGTMTWTTSEGMKARYFANTVLLPNGKLMAVGGTDSTGTRFDNGQPVKEPQIWDPATLTWTAPGTLAEQAKKRNYHSSAILLPCGRVLSASGEDRDSDCAGPCDKYFAEIYCPPYLFKDEAGNLATRPAIDAAPLGITWRDTFTVCVPTTANLSRACLIRPGAATHGFDQNQRYVPLQFEPGSNPPRLHVTAPASPDSAPPGYYLLFLTGSADGPDVPAIARWVHLRSGAGRDTCDVTAPDTLHLIPDAVGSTTAYLAWTATADDRSLTESGRAVEFDLRYRTGPINDATSWGLATQYLYEPAPGGAGADHEAAVGPLAPCTWYHFAGRARDDNQLLSGFHAEVRAKTLGSGCGSLIASGDAAGTAAMRPDATRTNAGRSAQAGVAGAVESGAIGLLVVETLETPDGWRVTARREPSVPGTTPGTVASQARDSLGAWTTRYRFRPSDEDDELGVCAFRNGGRLVLPAEYDVVQIGSTLSGPRVRVEVTEVVHSASGALDREQRMTPAATALGSNDTLTVTLANRPSDAAPAESWYLLVRRNPAQIALARTGESGSVAAYPARVALHPNVPNPFRGSTEIAFDLSAPHAVDLEVFDLTGRRVRVLVRGERGAGTHRVDWDLRDDAGQRVGPGLYLYRLRAGEFRAERKMTVMP